MPAPQNPDLKRAKGRPRDEKAHLLILKSTLKEISKVGFRSLSMDQIANAAGVGKMTLYRRWPNKAALVMDAFLELVGPETEFPKGSSILNRIEKQLVLQAKFFSGPYGSIISTLIGEAQFDPDLATAFYEGWLLPRRLMTRKILELGNENKELRIADYEIATDMLYGPFYYRLMLKNAPLDKQFVSATFAGWCRAFAV